ncbi:zinc finger protein [Fragilaria crotonensis]|nr:zinc finger protein [Fragilaria crotonensis]
MDGHVPQCIVCYTDLTHPCVTPCAHNEVCGTCHLRLRYLHSDKKCPICKQENQQIIVDRFENVKLFEEYPLWGDELGADYIFRDDVGMFFPKEYYDAHILSLFGNHCGVCNNYDGVNVSADGNANSNQDPSDKRNNHNQQQQGKKGNRAAITPVKSLLDHLRNKHRLTLCEFCIDHKRDFVALLPRFTPSQLRSHMASGDSIETGFRGHPVRILPPKALL